MDKTRQLLELEQFPPFVAFLEHLKEKTNKHLDEAVYLASKGDSAKAAVELQLYNDTKTLWSNFRSSYNETPT